jgi:hypothetical protein
MARHARALRLLAACALLLAARVAGDEAHAAAQPHGSVSVASTGAAAPTLVQPAAVAAANASTAYLVR